MMGSERNVRPGGKVKLRPPVKWHGGKHYLAERIIACFPPHRVYLEPFGGAASVLLNKPPAEVEAYSDLDLRITRLFRVLQKQGSSFAGRRTHGTMHPSILGNHPLNASSANCSNIFPRALANRVSRWPSSSLMVTVAT